MSEEANKRANLMFNFLLQDAKTTIEAYEALPQSFKYMVNLSLGIEPGFIKQQSIIDKERYLKIIEAGIDSLGIGSSRKVTMSERIDYKACCDEITRICAKLDEYITHNPGDESNKLNSNMDLALSQAIGELQMLEQEIK